MIAWTLKGHPPRIISSEKLVVPETGPVEGRKIADLVYGKQGFDEWMIDEEVSSEFGDMMMKQFALTTINVN